MTRKGNNRIIQLGLLLKANKKTFCLGDYGVARIIKPVKTKNGWNCAAIKVSDVNTEQRARKYKQTNRRAVLSRLIKSAIQVIM